jgi:predicted metal-dependent hydrolase
MIPDTLTHPVLRSFVQAVMDEADDFEAARIIDCYRLAVIDDAMKLARSDRGQHRIAYRWLLDAQNALREMWDAEQAAEIRAEGGYLRAAESGFYVYDDPRGD